MSNGVDSDHRRIVDASESLWTIYENLSRAALQGDTEVAVAGLSDLLKSTANSELQARIQNDLGVIAAINGSFENAHRAFEDAQRLSPCWSIPEENLRRLPLTTGNNDYRHDSTVRRRKTRIAIVSLLFNWPSTGGGTVHTAELARFLVRAGYELVHFVVRFPGWGVGEVVDLVDWPLNVLEFDAAHWNRTEVQHQVRTAVDRFSPDSVILTDSWSFKPRLAEALSGMRYYIRLAAQECLCPLNNVRLLWNAEGVPQSCPQHQLATPDTCLDCVQRRNHWSGPLHRAERALSGYGEADYDASLRSAFSNATGVLVVNPLIAEMVKPYARAVHIIPSGFDPERFRVNPRVNVDTRIRILFAGLVEEPMKGFEVLHSACRRLWSHRRDFVLLATADPPGRVDDFTEYIGWQTQADLPQSMADADILVCPTIAEEALGRTAVEAMAAAKPVVASRLGGLPFVVHDEATGLLFEPGDSSDLTRQLSRLMDDPDLRHQLGTAGRRRFDQFYPWSVIIRRHYQPLLGPPVIAD